MHKAYVLVEGRGEEKAAQNLLVRLSEDVGYYFPWARPIRMINSHLWESDRHQGGVKKYINWIRTKKDVGALLIMRDEDDGCPKELAPDIARRISRLNLHFPVAYVLLHPEYEVLFLPCLELMAGDFPDGRKGLKPGTKWNTGWEARRGIKEWLSSHFQEGRRYKPSLDQLPMTRRIDFSLLRSAGVPSFGSLERAIKFLGEHFDSQGYVYPSPFST